MKSIQALVTVLLACIAAALFGVSQANLYEYEFVGEGRCLDKNGNSYSGFTSTSSINIQSLDECKKTCECVEGVKDVELVLRGITYISSLYYMDMCFCHMDPNEDLAFMVDYCGAIYTSIWTFPYQGGDLGGNLGIGQVGSFDDSPKSALGPFETISCLRKVVLEGGGGNGGGDNSEGSYSMSYSSKGGKSGVGGSSNLI